MAGGKGRGLADDQRIRLVSGQEAFVAPDRILPSGWHEAYPTVARRVHARQRSLVATAPEGLPFLARRERSLRISILKRIPK